ncbi:hypothetical protein [Kutzneria sp. 744]|uniref:hypothetical protein n=1 Tax=Kutzneria sp. (strain 744) TaxID=345341 RepID=UPI0003EED06A|nr:hypothetical protein [Kutzneria sp. 744]EWM10023.1 hypothetical protein KUTG_00327 [Kutzneria sp. 744]
MTLSSLARYLAAHVADAPRQKIEVGALYAAAVEFDRSLATAPAARGEIRHALDELVAAGLVMFPRSLRDFDTRDEPHLPRWVRRPARERVVREKAPVRVWPAALEAAGRIAHRDEELALLDTVTAFLRDSGATRPNVPMRERSLELFGDEKRLDRLLSTRLFTSGALTLNLLRCHTVPIPFVSQWVPGIDDPKGTALLIAENHHTYTSLLEVTRHRAASGGPGRHVGYGTGGQFPSAVLSVPLLSPMPERIAYFGDVDLKGLQIPLAAHAAGSLAGLPGVVPAVPLYGLLFEMGLARPAKQVPTAVATEAAAWLGSFAAQARDALVNGVRFPQEAVGYELLMDRGERLDQV